MLDLYLERFAHLETATVGRLYLPNDAVIYTLERPWKGNRPFQSCIPSGYYEMEWDRTGRIKDTVRLLDVPDRTHINIHAANRSSELHGCIAPGLGWTMAEGDPILHQSRKALDLLLESLGFELSHQGIWMYGSDVTHEGLRIDAKLQVDSYCVPTA